MHQGGVRLCRAMLSIATAGFLAWGFCVYAIAPSDLVISKVQITGGTGLTTNDFVTIYNRSDAPIDLNGLRLVKRTKTGTTDTILKSWTSETIIQANTYYTWANSDIAAEINADTSSSQTIANDNAVALRQGASGEIIDGVGWGEAANIFVEELPFPTNPEGGQYIERIDNLDTNNNSTDFQIYPPTPEPIETPAPQPNEIIPPATGKDLIINELFVNPKDIDGQAPLQEFIEIYNKGTERAAFDDWRIEIGDIVFELPRGTSLAPGGFTSIRDPKNIPLPNNGATIKLFAPDQITASQTITYKPAPDGFSYANFSTAWRWTAIPTPDRTNILAQAPAAAFDILGVLLPNINLRFDSSDSFTNSQAAEYLWDFGNGQTSIDQYPQYSFTKSGKYKISLTVKTAYGSSEISKTITIADNSVAAIKTIAEEGEEKVLGEKITTDDTDAKPINSDIFTSSGTVVAKPGTFGVQYFYFLPEFGEPLFQIYNSKKLFPKIEVGDQLIITGKYSERPEGPRLTTKEIKDISIIGHDEIIETEKAISTDLKKAPYPRLALVEGEVATKKSPRIYLTDEQGEIEVYLSQGSKLKVSDFTIGDKISVTGIVSVIDDKVRIQPRDKNDIIKLDTPTDIKDFSMASEAISSAALSETINNAKELPRKNILLIYIVSGTVLAMGGVGYFMFKKK